MSKKTKAISLALVFIFGVLLCFMFFWSPFARQAKVERELTDEYSRIQLPANLELTSKNDFGDVILGSEKDWGIQYVYNFSGDYDSTVEAIKRSFIQANYNVQSNRCSTCSNTTTISGGNPQSGIAISANATDYNMPQGTYRLSVEVKSL